MLKTYIYAQRIVTQPRAPENPVLNALNEIDVIQTSLLRALASPHRLRIIHLLGERPRGAHDAAPPAPPPRPARMGRPVNVPPRSWALDAFRADRIENDHGLAYDAARPRLTEPVDRVGNIPWLETFRPAKGNGEASILARSGSLDALG